MHTSLTNHMFGRTGHFADHASSDTDYRSSDDAGTAAFARQFLPIDDLLTCLKESGDPDTVAPGTARWPRLRRALHTFWLLQQRQDVEGTAAGTLDAMAQPAFVLRANGQIDFSNAAAQRAVTQHPAIVTGCGRLVRVGEIASTDLTGLRPPTFAPITLDGRLRRAQVFVTPASDAPVLASAWPQAHCLLTLMLPDGDTPAATQAWLNALGRHHGLTGAEVRVLGLLAGGQDAAAMARSLSVSVATIRSHIRALFDKTGVRRQAELVRLALAD